MEEMIALFPQSGKVWERITDRSSTSGLALKGKMIYAVTLSNLSPAHMFLNCFQ